MSTRKNLSSRKIPEIVNDCLKERDNMLKAEDKVYRLSDGQFTVCSECKMGFNGAKSCAYGHELRTRSTLGCMEGEMLANLKDLPPKEQYKQRVEPTWAELDLVQPKHIIEKLKVSQSTFYRWCKREGFPKPVSRDDVSPKWNKKDIEEWYFEKGQ